jgi:hypothetical protein
MRMRFVLLALLVGLMAGAAAATTYVVPDEELEITEIQQAVEMASAGDTVLVMSGVYDSVSNFETPLGWRSAIVAISTDIVLLGNNREGVRIDQSEAEYGILYQNVSADAIVSNLTILGGDLRDKGLADDGDGRLLAAGICCIDSASPTIRGVDIVNGATGIVVRTGIGSGNSAPLIERVVVARGSHHGIFVYENGSEPVVIDRCTLVENFDNGIHVSGGNAQIKNSAITHSGKAGIHGYLAIPTVRYCNVFYNDEIDPDQVTGPLNYGGTLDDLTGIDGNISVEPFYCDFGGASGYDYHVCLTSPPSPHIGGGEGGVTIGALPAQCSGCVSPVEATSWGAIKALYAR